MAVQELNADLSRRVVIRADLEPWIPSPQPGVMRRPLDRRGAESGRATSIVRYEPGAAFPAHAHPGGEEILVLDGVFADDAGTYPAGTYILNPDGSRHAPRSEHGCVLFVKLCQYAGARRIVLDTHTLEWRPRPEPGVWIKSLYFESGHPEIVRILKFDPGARLPLHKHPRGEEFLVLEGELSDEQGVYPRYTWVRNPAGSTHTPVSRTGCVLYHKAQHL